MCLGKKFQREGGSYVESSVAWGPVLGPEGYVQMFGLRGEGVEQVGEVWGRLVMAGFGSEEKAFWNESVVRQEVSEVSGGQGWCGHGSRSE